MGAIPFIRGTTDRRDGGGRSVLVDGQALGGVHGLFRLLFHAGRTRRPWPCAVTGIAIPVGDFALVPHLGACTAGPFLEPFRVSLEGWRLLAPGAAPHAPEAGRPIAPA